MSKVHKPTTTENLMEKFLACTHIDDLEAKLLKLNLSYHSIKYDYAKTRYYTGMQTFMVFSIVFEQIEPFIKVNKNTVLSPKDQILTFVKLRLNLDYRDLAYRFVVVPTTASRYFKNVLHVMYIRFKNFVFWPTRDVLRKTMPSCFKKWFNEKTTIIIDCFEMRTQHSQTIKYLIGISLQGKVCFINEG